MRTARYHIAYLTSMVLLPYLVMMSINSPEAASPFEKVGSAANTADVSVIVLLDDVGIDFAAGDHDTSKEEDAPQISMVGVYLVPVRADLRPLSWHMNERIPDYRGVTFQSHSFDVLTPPPNNVSS